MKVSIVNFIELFCNDDGWVFLNFSAKKNIFFFEANFRPKQTLANIGFWYFQRNFYDIFMVTRPAGFLLADVYAWLEILYRRLVFDVLLVLFRFLK